VDHLASGIIHSLFTVVLVSDDVLGDANDGARVESRRDLCLKLD